MRIAMVIDAWYPIVGGGQVHVSSLVNKLVSEHGCEVDLFVRSLKDDDGVSYDSDEILLNGKFRIFRCGRPKPFFHFFERILSVFSIARAIVRENRKTPYDVVHAHAFLGLLSGKIAAWVLRKPVIATVHGANLLDNGKRGVFYYVEKFLLTQLRYDAEITVGSSFLKHPNVNAPVVIPNGVNVEDFDDVDVPKDEGFPVLFVGRFEWTKGIDVLIDAVARIRDAMPGFLERKGMRFRMVGYGYSEDEYRNRIAELGLGAYFIFLGKKTGAELVSEYKKARLLVLPSRTEGFGMTIIEAMAAKTLVLSTRCGGPEDIIRDGENGFLVNKDDFVALAEALTNCVNLNAASAQKIAESGYSDSANSYSWKRVGDETYGIYEGFPMLS